MPIEEITAVEDSDDDIEVVAVPPSSSSSSSAAANGVDDDEASAIKKSDLLSKCGNVIKTIQDGVSNQVHPELKKMKMGSFVAMFVIFQNIVVFSFFMVYFLLFSCEKVELVAMAREMDSKDFLPADNKYMCHSYSIFDVDDDWRKWADDEQRLANNIGQGSYDVDDDDGIINIDDRNPNPLKANINHLNKFDFWPCRLDGMKSRDYMQHSKCTGQDLYEDEEDYQNELDKTGCFGLTQVIYITCMGPAAALPLSLGYLSYSSIIGLAIALLIYFKCKPARAFNVYTTSPIQQKLSDLESDFDRRLKELEKIKYQTGGCEVKPCDLNL